MSEENENIQTKKSKRAKAAYALSAAAYAVRDETLRAEKAKAIKAVAAPISKAVVGSMRREMDGVADERDRALARAERYREALERIADAEGTPDVVGGWRIAAEALSDG